MIRALKAADVKAAGTDRLKLKDHIAVMASSPRDARRCCPTMI